MNHMRIVLSSLLVAALAVGCAKSKDSKEDKNDDKKVPPPQQAKLVKPVEQAEPPKQAEPKPVEGPMADVMAAYAAAHDALFADKTDGVAAAAAKISEAAAKAAESADDAAKPHYAELAKAAGELAKAADVKAARVAYGEVSKHLVMIMDMNPDLAGAHHVFECPMAEGYKKWIQSNAELANPYMGTQMPKCGAEVAFAKHDMPAAKGGMKGHGGH